MKHKVLVLMGSKSDLEVMESGKPYYEYFGIETDFKVSSAHRDPDQTIQLARTARNEGYQAIVCGAGMAAHLAGVAAAHSDLPVIAVPLEGGILEGLDALLSSVQMPSGIPVATLSIGKAGAINAATLCARIFSLGDKAILDKLSEFKAAGSKL
jgi:phosphoribosylaminoimidazole carboxylase PurE protein